jgi:hypothetical protein
VVGSGSVSERDELQLEVVGGLLGDGELADLCRRRPTGA